MVLTIGEQAGHPDQWGVGDNGAENEELCPQGGTVPAGGGYAGAGA